MSDDRYYCNQKFSWLTIDIEKLATQSCCSAAPQKIDMVWLNANPGKIFNTLILHQERQMMLNNIPVDSCADTCWVPESNNLLSRRLLMNSNQKTHTNINAKTERLNIIVNKHCNLTCVYCCKQYSTAWLADINTNGDYSLKEFDDRFTINSKDKIFNKLSQKDINLSKNHQTLLNEIQILCENSEIYEEIEITGGEPFLYLYLNKLVQSLPKNLKVDIYTGLGVDTNRFIKELDKLSNHPNVCLTISAETITNYYEFIRWNNSWQRFEDNLRAIQDRGIPYTFNAVLSNLTLFGINDFLTYTDGVKITYNLCSDPDFLSINIMDNASKEIIKNNISNLPIDIQDKIKNKINENPTELQKTNFKKYLLEFARRRNLSIDIFPKTFINWINDVV